MKLDKKEAKFSVDFDGQKYYFCSQDCKDKFGTDPKTYTIEESHKKGCCH